LREKSIVDPGEVAAALHRAGDSAIGGQASINLLGIGRVLGSGELDGGVLRTH
jgi:hypothetical protein